jgi:hypothetical protein
LATGNYDDPAIIVALKRQPRPGARNQRKDLLRRRSNYRDIVVCDDALLRNDVCNHRRPGVDPNHVSYFQLADTSEDVAA